MKELSIEDKKLLLKDLCMRLPYGVICKCYHTEYDEWDDKLFIATYDSPVNSTNANGTVFADGFDYEIDEVRPYLRPMSSMTEEEKEELNCLCYHNIGVQDERICGYICADEMYDVIDWLNKNMFDYRGLIPKGLALVAPEGMYKID